MIFNFMLVLVLFICFITDLKEQKIYNKVIFPCLAMAVFLHGIYFGLDGLKGSIIGFAVGFGILLIPYFMGGIGAGDVKLLALIGAIKGSIFVLNTAVYMALIGGVIAFVIILFHRESLKLFKQIGLKILYVFFGIKVKLELPSSPFLKKYPYGVAIVGGALICLVFKGAWII